MRALLPVCALVALVACGGSPVGPGDGGVDGARTCTSDHACDDGLFCNAVETCHPGAAGSDGHGCVPAVSPCGALACDEGARMCSSCMPRMQDQDHDGHRALDCGGDDCDDGDPNRYPGNVEVCDTAGADEDCDPRTLGVDADHDGFVSSACCNSDAAGAMTCGDDCDDGAMGVNPGTPESCNGVDDDCDGTVDDALSETFYADCDADGYGAGAGTAAPGCTPPSTPPTCPSGAGTWSTDATDCDDAVATTFPAAPENCNGADDDCDGAIDEDTMRPFMPDCDLDGYAATGSPPTLACTPPTAAPASCPGGAWSELATDCDDAHAAAHPGASETCNGVDDDCNGAVDGAAADAICMTVADRSVGRCVAAACTYTCAAAYIDCDGSPASCEVESSSAQTNCGACGHDCYAGRCASGACTTGFIAAMALGGSEALSFPYDSHGFTCALRTDGTVTCWGYGGDGQLADPTLASRSTPRDVPGITDATAIGVGYAHTCVVRAGGAVSCWGSGGAGQLGNGSTTSSATPVDVVGVTGAVAVVAGTSFTCALLSSGSVRCWGDNSVGQLGDGTTTSAPRATTVSGLTDATQLAASPSGAHACARRTGGTVVCWGDGRAYQNGDGIYAIDRSPVTVMGLSDATMVGVGTQSACARRATGGVLCWGDNYFGQLGQGEYHTHTTPVVPIFIPSAATVQVSGNDVCVTTSSGELWCWGIGGLSGGGAPTLNTSFPGFTTLWLGPRHACAQDATHTVYCVGDDADGELGRGPTGSGGGPSVVLGS